MLQCSPEDPYRGSAGTFTQYDEWLELGLNMHLDAAIYGRFCLFSPVKVAPFLIVEHAHCPPVGSRAMAVPLDTTVYF